MTERIDGGSKTYWQEQREGFARIDRFRQAKQDFERGREGIIPLSNAHDEAATHRGAVRILRANGLQVEKPTPESQPVILDRRGVYVQSKEIPVFGKK